MKVTVHLFSHVRHQLGCNVLELTLDHGSCSSDVEAHVRAKLPEAFREQPFRLAVNYALVDRSEALQDGDEVAVLPPMQGG